MPGGSRITHDPMPFMDTDLTIPLVPYGTSQRGTRNNDLEQLLQNIYKQKLEYPSDHPEVNFIRKATETIFMKIAAELNKYKKTIFETVGASDPNIVRQLEEITDDNLWKLGSFYERTKNHYPEELDYVYVPFRLSKVDCPVNPSFELRDEEFRKRITYLANSGSLVYRDDEVGEMFLESYDNPRGVASQLRFCFVKAARYYRRGKRLKRHINVTLIPGILLVDPDLKDHISELCPIPGFRQLILETASCQYLLLPEGFTSFSETEVHFMNHVLSEKHRKVYRLLKYIVNGNGSCVELDEICSKSKHNIMCSIPSYAIKTALIRHHYECQDAGQDVGGCVLAVLHMFEQSYSFPMPRYGEDNAHVYIEIATPTNRPLTLAYGDEDFILTAQRCLSKLVQYLRHYKKRTANDLILDTFSTRMTTRVIQYNNAHGNKYQRARLNWCGDFGIDTIGHYCYSLLVVLVVIGFCSVMLWAFIHKPDKA